MRRIKKETKTNQQEQKLETIKKDNKKAIIPFAIMLIISMVGGGIIGAVGVMGFREIKDPMEFSIQLENNLILLLGNISPWIMVGTSVVSLIVCLLMLGLAKKEFRKSSYVEDDDLRKIEMKLTIALMVSIIQMMIQFLFFSLATMSAFIVNTKESAINVFLAVFLFFVGVAISIVLQQQSVDFTKEMNPEKQGSVYDKKFAKKWLESCDEAEQLIIYKASYKAYQTTNMLCIGLWLVLTMLGYFLRTGLLAIVIVITFWAVINIAYSLEASKLENGSK